jgi:hypothetical protein
MKKLYVVTAKTLVWADDDTQVINALSTIDTNDMWVVQPNDIVEVEGEADIPSNWDIDTCPVDSDRCNKSDFWATYSTRQILENMAYEKFPPKGSAEDKVAALELRVAELTAQVNNLVRAKLYA